MIPSSEIASNLNTKDDNLILGVNESGEKVLFETIGEYRYILPSEGHNNNNNGLRAKNTLSNILTINDLFYEYYDETLDQKVDVSRNYNAGDKVKVTDTLIGLEYDSDIDATLFEFKSDFENQYVAFKGDLTNQYKIGDSLSFNFSIVSLHEGYEYTTIDYTKITSNGIIPNIEEYLVK